MRRRTGRRQVHVKNFEKFQHYRDRAPIWIKLYGYLLEDYEFNLLPDVAAAAAQKQEGHKSAFSFYEVRRYVEATKLNATNPGGLARSIWRSGEEDPEIRKRFGQSL